MSAERRQLIPKPHLMMTFFNADKTWAELICELIDNSFDDAAGNSKKVRIKIGHDYVEVLDMGRGVDDINRLVTAADSGSFVHSGNIGQYGIGAKAWMSKADVLDVMTVRDGTLHRHRWDARPILGAIASKKEARFFYAYTGKGTPTSLPSTTVIRLSHIRSKQSIHVPALVGALERTYWPGLLSGREIVIEDFRKSPTEVQCVLPMQPPEWTDRVEFESQVGGRKYRATVGLLTDKVARFGGLYIGYLFRNVVIANKLPNRRYPSRVHGQVVLSDDWRHCLSHYKDNLIEGGLDALLLDIEEKARTVFDMGDEFVEDLRLENISSTIASAYKGALRRSTIGRDGLVNPMPTSKDDDEAREEHDDASDEPRKIKSRKRRRVFGPTQTSNSAGSGIKIGWSGMGGDELASVDLHGGVITVVFNKNCAKLMALSQQPRWPGLYLVIGAELSAHCDKLTLVEIEKAFGGMLGDSTGTEDKQAMKHQIRLWWAFVADDDDQEIAA